MTTLAIAVLWALAIPAYAAGVLKGIATLHETQAAGEGATIRGTIEFTVCLIDLAQKY